MSIKNSQTIELESKLETKKFLEICWKWHSSMKDWKTHENPEKRAKMRKKAVLSTKWVKISPWLWMLNIRCNCGYQMKFAFSLSPIAHSSVCWSLIIKNVISHSKSSIYSFPTFQRHAHLDSVRKRSHKIDSQPAKFRVVVVTVCRRISVSN